MKKKLTYNITKTAFDFWSVLPRNVSHCLSMRTFVNLMKPKTSVKWSNEIKFHEYEN